MIKVETDETKAILENLERHCYRQVAMNVNCNELLTPYCNELLTPLRVNKNR